MREQLENIHAELSDIVKSIHWVHPSKEKVSAFRKTALLRESVQEIERQFKEIVTGSDLAPEEAERLLAYPPLWHAAF